MPALYYLLALWLARPGCHEEGGFVSTNLVPLAEVVVACQPYRPGDRRFFYFILSLSSIYRLMVLSPLFVVLIHESLWSKPRRLSTPTRTELAFKLHLEELILLFPLFLFFSSKLFALLSPFSVLSAQVAFSLREGRGIWVTWVVSILPWSPTICMERRE